MQAHATYNIDNELDIERVAALTSRIDGLQQLITVSTQSVESKKVLLENLETQHAKAIDLLKTYESKFNELQESLNQIASKYQQAKADLTAKSSLYIFDQIKAQEYNPAFNLIFSKAMAESNSQNPDVQNLDLEYSQKTKEMLNKRLLQQDIIVNHQKFLLNPLIDQKGIAQEELNRASKHLIDLQESLEAAILEQKTILDKLIPDETSLVPDVGEIESENKTSKQLETANAIIESCEAKGISCHQKKTYHSNERRNDISKLSMDVIYKAICSTYKDTSVARKLGVYLADFRDYICHLYYIEDDGTLKKADLEFIRNSVVLEKIDRLKYIPEENVVQKSSKSGKRVASNITHFSAINTRQVNNNNASAISNSTDVDNQHPSKVSKTA